MRNEELTILTVLKFGGDFTTKYLRLLRNALEEAGALRRAKLFCLTDSPGEVQLYAEPIPLLHDFPGWWSKIELFRSDIPNAKAVYLDLDTLLLGRRGIDALLNVPDMTPLAPLRGFNQSFRPPHGENFASGIMAGNFGSYNHVYKNFVQSPDSYINEPRKGWMHGDQGFIADQIGVNEVSRLQDFLPEGYIVGKKATNRGQFIPYSAHVLAWSGNPRFDIAEGPVGKIWSSYDY